MKTFKEVAHLYVGCKVMRPDNKTVLQYIGVQGNVLIFQEKDNIEQTYGNVNKCKPMLYPLSSMSKEQMKDIIDIGEHVCNLCGSIEAFVAGWRAFGPSTFDYLLSQSFDLFQLIENGEAIDGSKEVNNG